MKILVFGGSGFIGKHLISSLSSADYKIIGFSRNPEKTALPADKNVEWVRWESKNTETILSYCTGEYAIINLAGENIGSKLWTKSQKAKILSSRIAVTQFISLVLNQSAVKPAVFFQGSAAGYYGSQGDRRIVENTGKGTGFLAEVVDLWEKSLKLQDMQSTRVIFLRTGIVLGNTGGIWPRMILPYRFYLGGHPGNGKQWLSWIHIDDLVNAIVFILQNNGISGICNLTSPEPVQMKFFSRIISQSIGKPAWLNIPAFLLNMLPGGMAGDLFLTSQKILPDRLIKAGFEFRYKDIRSAINDLIIKSK